MKCSVLIAAIALLCGAAEDEFDSLIEESGDHT